VAFTYPPDHSQADVKRVIALAGSTVEIRNSVVLVDGKPIDEPYLHAVIPHWNVPRSMARMTVPAGSSLSWAIIATGARTAGAGARLPGTASSAGSGSKAESAETGAMTFLDTCWTRP